MPDAVRATPEPVTGWMTVAPQLNDRPRAYVEHIVVLKRALPRERHGMGCAGAGMPGRSGNCRCSRKTEGFHDARRCTRQLPRRRLTPIWRLAMFKPLGTVGRSKMRRLFLASLAAILLLNSLQAAAIVSPRDPSAGAQIVSPRDPAGFLGIFFAGVFA